DDSVEPRLTGNGGLGHDQTLTRIFHQDAELWRSTGRDRSGSTGAANRSFYWQDGHARYGRPEPARIRVTPNPIWPQTKRPWIGCTDAPASKRGWPGEISGLTLFVSRTQAAIFAARTQSVTQTVCSPDQNFARSRCSVRSRPFAASRPRAPLKLVPSILASSRFAPARSAPLKSAPERSAR